jgi:hypothetical protein
MGAAIKVVLLKESTKSTIRVTPGSMTFIAENGCEATGACFHCRFLFVSVD